MDLSNSATLDIACRVCWLSVDLYPMETLQRNILTWMFNDLNLTFQSMTLQICKSCKRKVMASKEVFSRKRSCKKRISLVVWDYTISAPVFNAYNEPFKYSIGPNRNLDGTLRKSDAQFARDEIAYEIGDCDIGSLSSETEAIASPILEVSPTEIVRRSTRNRKSKSTIQTEKQNNLEQCIRSKQAEGLRIQDFGIKGRGIVATRPFSKGDFVIEYIGELMDQKTAKAKEESYAHDPSKGCYSYYFLHSGQWYCIDATEESPYMGRLVNHSCKIPNMVTKTIELDNIPHLVLVAKRDIAENEEILYDYGDKSKEALEYHPWLAL